MTNRYDAKKIEDLAGAIQHHKRLYYSGKPEISDKQYDAIETELRALAPNHPVLEFVGTDELTETLPKVPHDEPMLSLQKTYVVDDLFSWQDNTDIVGMYKIDGNSLSVIYENATIKLAKTRGNGRMGEDVTIKARWVSEIIPILAKVRNAEIRGELFCHQEQFILLSRDMQARGLEPPTNPRNIVAGLLGRKSHVDLSRYFSFFAFDIKTDEISFATEWEKFQFLKDCGFQVPGPKVLKDKKQIEDYLESVKSVMNAGEIGIDGAVFSYNDLNLHKKLGNTSHHPRYKMSFKWQGETAEAQIEKIHWATSRLGIVTPVAVIEPVYLSGAQISNVTLHNASHVTAHNLKAGDTIEIVRSGEVIPKFLQTTQSAAGKATLPDTCPSCSGPLEFDDVRLKCVNINSCPAQQVGVILNWIKSVDIEDLSEKRLIPLIEKGLVKSAADLYQLSYDDFFVIPNTKDKMATKLLDNITKSKSLVLAQFLNGLGIEGAGLTTWEKLILTYPRLNDVRQAKWEHIMEIDGFAEKSAKQIVAGLADKSTMIDELLAVGVKPEEPTRSSTASSEATVLSGKTFVITGTLSQPRSTIEKMIKSAGGKTSSSVSKNTTAVITGDPSSTSSKMTKAKNLGVEIWSEADLEAAIH